MRLFSLLTILTSLLIATDSLAAVVAREETREGRKILVLENDLVRMAVAPDPGGTVVEFIHKPSGTNFVYGGDEVLKGRLGKGWKDFYWLEAPDKFGSGVFSLPYTAEFRTGPDYKAIAVSCEAEGRRFEREMRLAENTAEFTTLDKVTNISDAPLRIQCRWHTYSTLDDLYAEYSCIISPGPAGEARKCFIGSGFDHQFITGDPFWLAINYKTGVGMWMTFRKGQSPMQITWTDSQAERHIPARGAYVAEPNPQPVLAQPGQSVQYEGTFYPFTAADSPQSIAMGMLSEAEQVRARDFLASVKPNAAAIGPYTMTQGQPPAGLNPKPDENRFEFGHRRRDRFALRPWGILDAMMAVPGVQDQAIRCRYYVRLFDSVQKPVKVSFRLHVIDALGITAQENVKEYTIDPAQKLELDVRDDVPMTGLPDGGYQFVLEGYVEGEKEPIHAYVENRRLVGQARPAYEKMMAEKATGLLVERPFVTALRKAESPAPAQGRVAIPIGVEEGSGIARTGWPVRCGVPFAQGSLVKDAAFQIAGPDRKPVPLQTQVMATWLDGSIKWLLVDFPADVPANGYGFYTLENKSSDKQPDLASEKDGLFTINGNTFHAAEGKLLGLFDAKDLWWTDGSGEMYYFRVQGENAGIAIEENGPNRAVIKASGWYFNAKDRAICMGELRLEHYRSQSFVKLYHTVTFAGDPWRDALGSYGLRLQLPKSHEAQVQLDGKAVSGQQLSLFQRNSDGAVLTADGKTTTGTHSIGAVRLGDAAVYHADFWQMAPKKLDVDAAAGCVTFSYWPTEAGGMSFVPREDGWIPASSDARALAVGVSRTHEIIIDLRSPAAVTDFEKLFSEPVVACVPPKYLASTKAMMHLAPYDPDHQPVLEHVISDTMDYYIAQRQLFGWYGEWFFGGIPNVWRPDEYRWWNFGRYACILNEQDIAEAPWLCYMRSGDRKYLKLAQSNTRHLMEVGTIRWNPVWPREVGLSRRHHECMWLGAGDTGHSMLDPFLDYYYATGYRPARDAADRMAMAMSRITSGGWRYIANPVAGLSRMYLDTQNPYYKEHADRIWNTLCAPDKNDWWYLDHGDRMAMWYSQINPQCLEIWKTAALNPELKRLKNVDSLTALYLQTGDKQYLDAAAKLVPTERMKYHTQHVLSALRAWCYIQ